MDIMTFKKCKYKKDATYAVLPQVLQIIILLDHLENHISQFCNTHSINRLLSIEKFNNRYIQVFIIVRSTSSFLNKKKAPRIRQEPLLLPYAMYNVFFVT